MPRNDREPRGPRDTGSNAPERTSAAASRSARPSLLEAVAFPHAVNPDRRLRRVATERCRTVHEFRGAVERCHAPPPAFVHVPAHHLEASYPRLGPGCSRPRSAPPAWRWSHVGGASAVLTGPRFGGPVPALDTWRTSRCLPCPVPDLSKSEVLHAGNPEAPTFTCRFDDRNSLFCRARVTDSRRTPRAVTPRTAAVDGSGAETS